MENDWGRRVFHGSCLDAFLCKWGSIRGYTPDLFAADAATLTDALAESSP